MLNHLVHSTQQTCATSDDVLSRKMQSVALACTTVMVSSGVPSCRTSSSEDEPESVSSRSSSAGKQFTLGASTSISTVVVGSVTGASETGFGPST